jgi:hypothetical protein
MPSCTPTPEDVLARLGPQADVRAEMRRRDVETLRASYSEVARGRQDDQAEIRQNMTARRAAPEERSRMRPGRR